MNSGDNPDGNGERMAYTLAEVAQMCGKHRSWAYRQWEKGRIKAITGYGTALVSRREIERLLGDDADPGTAR
jgi:hypothetical protein